MWMRQRKRLLKSSKHSDPTNESSSLTATVRSLATCRCNRNSARGAIPPQPLDVVGAMTQGQIGYMFQHTLQNRLAEAKLNIPVVSLVNQVLVSKDDPEFVGENASKPVGNFLSEAEAMQLKQDKGWIVKKVKPTAEKPWRRVVPSPDPIKNIEADVVCKLVDAGVVVIASGGGGIPVVENKDGGLVGVEAVIDKDLAGERLAEAVKATHLVILTDVENAMLNYGKPEAKNLEKVSLAEMQDYSAQGHFLAGSMGPKIKACMRFVEYGGAEAIVTSLNKAHLALQGECGTHIVA